MERRPSFFEVGETSGVLKGPWNVGRPIAKEVLKGAKALGGF